MEKILIQFGIATSDGGSIVVGKTITSGGWWVAVKIGPGLPSTTGDMIDGDAASLKWTVTIGQPRSKSVFLNAASTSDAVFLAGCSPMGVAMPICISLSIDWITVDSSGRSSLLIPAHPVTVPLKDSADSRRRLDCWRCGQQPCWWT